MRACITKLLGLVEIIGGVVGLMLAMIGVATNLLKSAHHHHFSITAVIHSIFIPFAFVIIFVLTIRAGLMLYRDQALGYRLSAFIQILQLPVILLKNFSYNFIVLFSATVGYISNDGGSRFSFNWVVGSQYWLHFSKTHFNFGLYINCMAVAFLILLGVCKRLPQEDDSSIS